MVGGRTVTARSSGDGGHHDGRSPPLEDASSALGPLVLGGDAAADLSMQAHPRRVPLGT